MCGEKCTSPGLVLRLLLWRIGAEKATQLEPGPSHGLELRSMSFKHENYSHGSGCLSFTSQRPQKTQSVIQQTLTEAQLGVHPRTGCWARETGG